MTAFDVLMRELKTRGLKAIKLSAGPGECSDLYQIRNDREKEHCIVRHWPKLGCFVTYFPFEELSVEQEVERIVRKAK